MLGDHCYIYTGPIAVNATEKDIVLTETGKYYVVGRWQPLNFSGGADNYRFRIFLNEGEVESVDLIDGNQYTPYQEIFIVIPPLTKLRITADNVTQNVNNNVGISLTGRIYDA